MLTRRAFLKYTGATTLSLIALGPHGLRRAIAESLPGGTLDPAGIPKFIAPMLIPPVMPAAGEIKLTSGKNADYYEIAVRQFAQQILPPGLPPTTVWGYGPINGAGSKRPVLIRNAPSLTIEARWNRPVRVKWINGLVDGEGRFLPHLLPVDRTLHWANPAGGLAARDTRPAFSDVPGRYQGPVPLVTHVHGAVGVGDESDGYAEAWYLPNAVNVPAGYARVGTWYDFFAGKAASQFGASWGDGFAICQYPNENRASTLWYHDHALGMTRVNVYAGPAGFYIVRGGPAGDDAVLDSRTGAPAKLPGPAPRDGDGFPPRKTYYEIPIAIQDRSFNADGSLFYPDSRQFFDDLVGPHIGEGHDDGDHDEHGGAFAPLWNPEFFGNVLMVNGNTWPYQIVEQRRYRFRLLNGCQSRFLILDFGAIPGVKVCQIGNEGGFLAAPVDLTTTNANQLLLGPAERADVIVDFTDVPPGDYVLGNVGPDEPFGGGEPGKDFPPADPATTGQVLEFTVVPALAADTTTPAEFLQLPAIAPLPQETVTRRLALVEQMGMGFDAEGNEIEGPVQAMLGRVVDGHVMSDEWMDEVTENPAVGSTEVWEIYNTTGDAHPIHLHEVVFEVVGRQGLATDDDDEVLEPIEPVGESRPAMPWETGLKDTVIAYPAEVTRVRARFSSPGQFVWHCHILEHEDNEMMRPFRVGPPQPGQPR